MSNVCQTVGLLHASTVGAASRYDPAAVVFGFAWLAAVAVENLNLVAAVKEDAAVAWARALGVRKVRGDAKFDVELDTDFANTSRV